MSALSTRAVWSWALYDFANSPFTTLVVTFVYATYFTQAIAADPIHGTALWSRGVTVTGVVVAVLSPLLGALADRGGYRKALVAAFTWLCIAATAALYFVRPGQVAAALALFVLANVAFELSEVFYNAFLPDIVPQSRIGRVSGLGWGMGYRFVPPRAENEFFGFFAFSGKLTAFIGPFLLGVLTDLSGSQRVGVAAVLALFIIGLPLLLWVDEREGVERAARG
jgi:UMF1 family MFS transporter